MARLRGASALAAAALLLALPTTVLAADPSASPAAATPAPPTCAERFPEEGPAGVDLRLGCIVSTLIAFYSTQDPRPPPTLSAYVISLAILIAALSVLALVVARILARRAGQRLAPVLPGEWWVCGRCHSVNAVGVEHCYSCGASPPAGPHLETVDRPVTPQAFGRTRKSG